MASRGKEGPIAQRFSTLELKNAVAFVASGNGDDFQRNMYFVPNAEFLESERKKANLSAARFLHVDLDYKDYPGDLKRRKTALWPSCATRRSARRACRNLRRFGSPGAAVRRSGDWINHFHLDRQKR
jgi:hypothetical protein